VGVWRCRHASKRQRPYNAHVPASCKIEPTILRYEGSDQCLGKLARASFASTNFELVRFPYLANRTQEVGVIRHYNVVIFGGSFVRALPSLKGSAIKLSRLRIIPARMIHNRQIAF